MKSTLVVLVLIVLGAAGYNYWRYSSLQQTQSPPASVASQTSVAQPATSPSESAMYPVPDETLPPGTHAARSSPGSEVDVDASNLSILQALSDLIGKERFESLFYMDNIIRRIVVSIDDAKKAKQTSQEFSPLRPLETEFRASSKGTEEMMGPSNFSRYLHYLDLIEIVDARKLVAVYVHFYPQFQSAYQELGAKGHFNDRLIAVIDDLLKTPDIKGPIQVARPTPNNKYKFVDDRLEGLHSGQKALLRMGYEATQVIKAKLRLLRTLLTHLRK